jgi:hypothetical protein
MVKRYKTLDQFMNHLFKWRSLEPDSKDEFCLYHPGLKLHLDSYLTIDVASPREDGVFTMVEIENIYKIYEKCE